MPAIFVHVPKTGGATIAKRFEGHVLHRGHLSARDRQDLREGWSFGFVRNPWDRMVSWYWWNCQERAGPDGFVPWVLSSAAESILGPWRSAEKILAGEDGEPLVDTVFRFEDYEAALEEIASRVGVSPEPVHVHLNPHKPKGLDWRRLYEERSWDRVRELCAWEAARYYPGL